MAALRHPAIWPDRPRAAGLLYSSTAKAARQIAGAARPHSLLARAGHRGMLVFPAPERPEPRGDADVRGFRRGRPAHAGTRQLRRLRSGREAKPAGTRDPRRNASDDLSSATVYPEEIMEIEIVAEIDIENQPTGALRASLAPAFRQPRDLRRRPQPAQSAAGGHRRVRNRRCGGLARRGLHPHRHCPAGFRYLWERGPCSFSERRPTFPGRCW